METSSSSRFDELLQQAVTQATEGAKKKKKKKKKDDLDTDSVLESLRKGEGLKKEEDETIKANMYDPSSGSSKEKNVNRKQKSQNTSREKQTKTDDEPKDPVKKKTKKPKNVDTKESDTNNRPLSPEITSIRSEQEEKSYKRTRKKNDLNEEKTAAKSSSEEHQVKEEKKKRKKKEPVVSESKEEVQETETTKTKIKTEMSEEKSDEREVKSAQKKKKKKNVDKDEEEKDESASKMKSTEEKDSAKESTPSKKSKGKEKKAKSKDKETDEVKKEEEEETDVKATASEDKDQTEETTPKKKAKKKKAKKTTNEDAEADTEPKEPSGDDTETQRDTEEAEATERREIEDEGQILAVTIHRTDKLKNDFHIMHPMVRVHIVDETTGQHLEKQHKDRAVTTFFETRADNVERILPIMTQPFDFKQQKSVLPVWEEVLIFNENYNYFTSDNPKVIIFFELMDFLSMNTATYKSTSSSQGGWYRIAWAFLKVMGNNKKPNTGGKVRLQLFVPPSGAQAKSNHLEVFQWWKKGRRETYPSTLYVTLKGINSPQNVEPAMRSMFATQEEAASSTYQEMKQSSTWKNKTRKSGPKTLASWSRLAGQTCRIPNNQLASLTTGSLGCFCIKFSHDGRSLACACQEKEQYPIIIYDFQTLDVPSFEIKKELKGHFNIVYDLAWSAKDNYLISASADGTARLWDMDETGKSDQLLPHPAYVYTSKIHPRADHIVATGGYDQVIRVWDMGAEDADSRMKQELEDHRGHVNSLCFDSDGEKMYSGDSTGTVIIWNVFVSESKQSGFLRDWTVFAKISDPEIRDIPINHLHLHHNGRRILIHCRDNIIRLFDLRVQRVMQKYIGALNFRERIRSTLSPCGTFVFSGSEDNCAYAWNTETGDQVAMYSELHYKQPVTDIDYHPRDHMIAMCCLGNSQPVLIYNYSTQIAQIDAGLSPRHIMTEPKIQEEEFTLRPSSPLRGTDSTLFKKTDRIMTKEEFQVAASARFDKVLKKLNSATSQMLSSGFDVPGTVTPRGPLPDFRTLESMQSPRSMMARPQAFTPHASHTMSNYMQQQQFTSSSMYMKSSDSDWRPGFAEVGRHGARSTSPTFIGRPPTLMLSQSHKKTQFVFQAPAGKAIPQYKQVVVLYDYRAQRSDELTIFKGDVISVLYKDSDQWWMGELADGQQGFFPASYVAEEIQNSPDELTPDDSSDEDDQKKKKKKLTAVTTKSGDLMFMSGNEDSEEELEKSSEV